MPQTALGRRLLLLLLMVPAFLGFAALAAHGGALLPHDWSGEFYLVKGVVSLSAVLLVVYHMEHTWAHVTSFGQRLRYLCLLVFVWLVASASVAQGAEDAPIAGRNVAGLFASALVVLAMVVSIRQDRQTYRR